MTRSERRNALNKLFRYIQINEFRKEAHFTSWQGEVAALLAYNPTLQSEFKEAVKTVPTDNYSVFDWSQYGVKANNDIRNVLAHAMSELGLPEEKQIAETPVLTDEHGIWWFMSHCTWGTRLALIISLASLLAAVFFSGFKLGMMDEVRSLYISFTNPHSAQPESSPTPAQPSK